MPFNDPDDESEKNALEILENKNYNKDGFMSTMNSVGYSNEEIDLKNSLEEDLIRNTK